jgi:hypothetical protein
MKQSFLLGGLLLLVLSAASLTTLTVLSKLNFLIETLDTVQEDFDYLQQTVDVLQVELRTYKTGFTEVQNLFTKEIYPMLVPLYQQAQVQVSKTGNGAAPLEAADEELPVVIPLPAANGAGSEECHTTRTLPLELTTLYNRWAQEANMQEDWILPSPPHQCQCTYFMTDVAAPEPTNIQSPCAPSHVGQRPWVVSKQIDVLVTSAGGVGTSFLINTLVNEFGLSVNDETNGDDLKHHPWPPSPDLRDIDIKSAIFVYDDPVDAVASLYRRGFAGPQAAIISNRNCKANDFPQSMAEFIRKGGNLFPFREFYLNWLHQPTAFPVAFVRLSDLWDHLPELCAFLNQPIKQCIQAFPPKKPRKSTVTDQDRAAIGRAYQQLSLEYDAVPRFMVKPSISGISQRPKYRKGGQPDFK